ncbi:hypothetical protein ACEPPN_007472 [Leptodophora sp. 'Broadleaf-Isolate-01']
MQAYYRNAYLTISALDSPDSHHGFLNQRKNVPYVKLTSDKNLYLRRRLPEQHEVFKNALLSRRAWVLQERLLSTRLLHYSSQELFWECLTCSNRESSLEERAGDVDPSSVILSEGDDFKRIFTTLLKSSPASRNTDAMVIWYRVMIQYSRKAMTRSSDKFPAISGIASAIHSVTGYSYIAGIWKEDPEGLLWFSDSVPDHQEGYIAPSWSWASSGAVSMRYGYEQTITSENDAEIINGHAENIGAGNFGQVSNASITLRAHTTDICYQLSQYKHRLNDKPWSMIGFETHRGQDIDLYMTASLGFGKGVLDVHDEELTFANGQLEKLSESSDDPVEILRPNFSNPKHNQDFKYRLYHPSLSMKRCMAIWIRMRVGEADSYMGGCENDKKGWSSVLREVLYCLLVVEDEVQKGKWRRIGIARAPLKYITLCEWSKKRNIVFV